MGSPVTFTADVTPVEGSGVPTGTIRFLINNVTAAEVALDETGKASYMTSSLPIGIDNIVMATYLGAPGQYQASNYTVVETTLGKVATPTFPRIGGTYFLPVPVVMETKTPGASIYYTVDGPTPTSKSKIYTGTYVAYTTQTIKAIAILNGEDSAVATATFTIDPSAIRTRTTLMSSANPAVAGDTVTFTAVVSGASGSTPTGPVVFKDNGKIIGTVSLTDGAAAFKTSALSAGTHQIAAVYAGSASDANSQAIVNQQMNPK
ncbi:Cell surface protein [Acidisarcina polymorpha]|uniref:Cell surface protein n=1 Tax=Acidisarcina polymorpha TaxID=2211140 RepID=A0A2Z5FWS2_9BACT|nr:Cell surface protein [Acidisarcina polymorpha]